jgi:hypothetical protein
MLQTLLKERFQFTFADRNFLFDRFETRRPNDHLVGRGNKILESEFSRWSCRGSTRFADLDALYP